MTTNQKSPSNSFIPRLLLSIFAAGIGLLVYSETISESFKVQKCPSDKSTEGCEVAKISNAPGWVKFACATVGSSFIVSSLTIAFLELALKQNNESELDKNIEARNTSVVSKIEAAMNDITQKQSEYITEAFKQEIVTTRDISAFHPTRLQYRHSIIEFFKSSESFPAISKKAKIDIIDVNGELTKELIEDLKKKMMDGLEIRLLIDPVNSGIRDKLKNVIDESKKAFDDLKNKNFSEATKLGSMEVALSSGDQVLYFDYFRYHYDSTSNAEPTTKRMSLCFCDSNGHPKLPGISVANQDSHKQFAAYFDSMWTDRRVNICLKIKLGDFIDRL
jgi:hypothetical protein